MALLSSTARDDTNCFRAIRPGRDAGESWRAPGLIPIPILEQIGDGKLEAGQEMFAFQESARADERALRRRVTDFNGFVFGINDPGDLSAAGEKVFQAVVYLGAGVVG